MASDSRLTLNLARQEKDKKIYQSSVTQSDSTYKTFLTPNNFGISTFGEASVKSVPIAGYVESFINEHLIQGNYDVDQIPKEILTYFRNMSVPPKTGFLIAGYKIVNNIPEQHIWEVQVSENVVKRLNQAGQQGASWRGEDDILLRLIKPVGLQDKKGKFQQLPYHQIQLGFFTLQDAIDYCIYAVKVTIDTMRFHPRPKTVGGPIDVLVIKPDKAEWVQRKELHV